MQGVGVMTIFYFDFWKLWYNSYHQDSHFDQNCKMVKIGSIRCLTNQVRKMSYEKKQP